MRAFASARPDEGPLTWDGVLRRLLRQLAVAAITAAVLFGELAHGVSNASPVALGLLAAAAIGVVASHIVARRRPDRLAVLLVPVTVLCALLGVFANGDTSWLFLFLPIGIAANRWEPTASAALAVGAALLYWVGYWLVHDQVAGPWLAVAIGASYLSGLMQRAYHGRVRQTARLLEQTERARVAEARSAALAERTRIAREMHDVLAHSLAGMAVQLEAADALLGSQRAEAAREVVRRCRRLAREGLAETKQAVLALREEVRTPLPDALRSLPDAYGLDGAASCTVTGPVRELDSEVEFALYRIGQEALANAAKHAPGAGVRLRLDYRPTSVELVVRNDAAPAPAGAVGSGYGLTGMRERVEPLGGEVSAGPVDGGWCVTAKIPL